MNENEITAGTIARTIILLLALANQVLGMLGVQIIPIEDEAINTAVSTIWTVIAALAAWWKNNSFTSAALMGDRVKNEVKAGSTVTFSEDREG